jgi:Heterokaryon incompatibility protein (HET)
MAPTFEYRPISEMEIRLLWITNTRDGDVLECRLQHFWLESKPQYTALSYVWGDPDDTVRLLLEDCDFHVTRNLHEALLQVRRWRKDPRFDYRDCFQAQGPWLLWIDAICIDQKNMAERLREIPRMKDIYSSAVTVLGWLGLPPPDIDELRIAAVFRKAAQIWLKTSQNERFDLIMKPEHPVRNEVSVNFEGFTKDFFTIIGLPWFSRVWIIQECAAARDDPILALGRVFTQFDCIRCLFSLYAYRHEWLIQPPNSGLGQISEIRVWYQDPELIHRILDNQEVPTGLDTSGSGCITNFARRLNIVLKTAALGHFSSTAPHDMLYGVLSMASEGIRTLPL